MTTFRLPRRLWLTADRSRVVEDGTGEAAFQLGPEGTEIPMEEAERLGLVPAAAIAPEVEAPREVAEVKESKAPVEDKRLHVEPETKRSAAPKPAAKKKG